MLQAFFESLDVEKPQRREAVIHGTRRNFCFETTQLGYSRMCRRPKRSGGWLNRREKSSTARM